MQILRYEDIQIKRDIHNFVIRFVKSILYRYLKWYTKNNEERVKVAGSWKSISSNRFPFLRQLRQLGAKAQVEVTQLT